MVRFSDLWHSHPINESVQTPCLAPVTLTNLEGKVVHQGLPVFSNQCAIRMSVALRRAGVTASQLPGVTTCGVHSREDMHFINANQLANAIARANLPGVGPRQIIRSPATQDFYKQLYGRTGLVYLQDYWQRSTDQPGRPTGDHIDVWNGYRSSAKWLMEWFSWLGYTGNYAHAGEIWFWDVK